MSGLLELAERCEKAEGPDRELDEAIWLAVTPGARAFDTIVEANEKRGGWTIREQRDGTGRLIIVPCYTASIDAAMTLVPEGLAWSGEFSDYNYANCWPDKVDYDGCPLGEGRGSSPALALCAAALRARASQ